MTNNEKAFLRGNIRNLLAVGTDKEKIVIKMKQYGYIRPTILKYIKACENSKSVTQQKHE